MSIVSVGARLSGELSLRRAKGELDEVDVTFDLDGTAGQSFGAFAGKGMKLILTGQANDFVGKGLSGADLILRAVGSAAEHSDEHVLLGQCCAVWCDRWPAVCGGTRG